MRLSRWSVPVGADHRELVIGAGTRRPARVDGADRAVVEPQRAAGRRSRRRRARPLTKRATATMSSPVTHRTRSMTCTPRSMRQPPPATARSKNHVARGRPRLRAGVPERGAEAGDLADATGGDGVVRPPRTVRRSACSGTARARRRSRPRPRSSRRRRRSCTPSACRRARACRPSRRRPRRRGAARSASRSRRRRRRRGATASSQSSTTSPRSPRVACRFGRRARPAREHGDVDAGRCAVRAGGCAWRPCRSRRPRSARSRRAIRTRPCARPSRRRRSRARRSRRRPAR